MAHYAKVLNGTVVSVIVADESFFSGFVDSSPGQWLQTSYNTRGNAHYDPETGQLSGQQPLRGNFAGVGYTYDAENDVFYAPQPGPEWILNTSTWLWEKPVSGDAGQ